MMDAQIDIRQRSDWKTVVGLLVGAAGIAWGIAKWAATTPTREEHNQTRDDIVRIRIEMPVMNAKIERLDQSNSRIEKAVEALGTKLDERKGRGR